MEIMILLIGVLVLGGMMFSIAAIEEPAKHLGKIAGILIAGFMALTVLGILGYSMM